MWCVCVCVFVCVCVCVCACETLLLLVVVVFLLLVEYLSCYQMCIDESHYEQIIDTCQGVSYERCSQVNYILVLNLLLFHYINRFLYHNLYHTHFLASIQNVIPEWLLLFLWGGGGGGE